MEKRNDSMTGWQWAELLSQKPELASPDVPWERLGILDWALLLKTQPQLEKFRPRLPPGCPYELLSIAEIMDLRREVEEDMKKIQELFKRAEKYPEEGVTSKDFSPSSLRLFFSNNPNIQAGKGHRT